MIYKTAEAYVDLALVITIVAGECMNKSELILVLAKELDMPAPTASSILETILETMTETMVSGDDIEIRGFGSFKVKTYKPYTGRNPKSGLKIEVSPKKLPYFKVGKELKERVDS